MSKPAPPADAVSLTDLRKEIDRIDETMHRLLMERGEIIGTLIKVKNTSDTGSAFRPAREADMMRRLVQRHHGILPLDTAESIWRVIIATFTHVQAPFCVHADLSAGDAAIRDSARFHFGFTVPFIASYGRGRRGGRRVGIARAISGWCRPSPRRIRRLVDRAGVRQRAARSSHACPSSTATTIRPRCRCSWSRARPPTPW